jgi:putative transposase
VPSPRKGIMHLPHLQPFHKQPILFITCCTADRKPLLARPAVCDILKAVWFQSASLGDWYVGQYLLMPDHVHFFAQPGPSAKPLPDWMKGWKSISSRGIAAACKITPPVWQADYFDHFVRSLAAYREKWDYVQSNPVRKELCQQWADWPYQGTLHDLRFK